MRYLTKATILLAMCALVGCAEPRIDASSDDALKASIAKVRSSLSDADRPQFDELTTNATASSALTSLLTGGSISPTAAMQPFDKLTGKEALAKFRQLVHEREERERAETQTKIATLEKRAADAESDVKRLDLVVIANTRQTEKKAAFMHQYELLANVHNGLDVPIASVKFSYSLKTPSRSVPWQEGEGYFFVDGGLEPGETRDLKATSGEVSMYGFLSLHNASEEHPDAALALKVTDVAGADKKSLLRARPLADFEVAELQRLRDSLAKDKQR